MSSSEPVSIADEDFHVSSRDFKNPSGKQPLNTGDKVPRIPDAKVFESFLTEECKIGKGGFASVFKGEYLGKTVAIKALKDKRRAIKESKMLFSVCSHPAIVDFDGVALLPAERAKYGRYLIVMELCQYGSLQKAMKKKPEDFNDLLKLKVLVDACSALLFLHSHEPCIMHRDLKPNNLVIASLDYRSDVCCKLADFGSARYLNCAEKTTSKDGSAYYQAPEILKVKDYDSSVDVYSFGMVMYYVLSGKEPYSEHSENTKEEICHKIAYEDLRPDLSSIPENFRQLRSLMEKCWSDEPSERPSFDFIYKTLLEEYQKCLNHFPSQML